jgi:hypothetical protein
MTDPDRRIRLASRTSSAAAIIAAALAPKCPLCVAAMLSALGVGSVFARFLGGVARPFAFTLAALAVVLLGFAELRRLVLRRRALTAPSCCSPSGHARGPGRLQNRYSQ